MPAASPADDPTYGAIDLDIQLQVAAMRPQSLAQRVAMENTLQARRERGASQLRNAPLVTSIEEAAFWIGVMHRRTCQDADNFAALLERVIRLERPWWKRWRRG